MSKNIMLQPQLDYASVHQNQHEARCLAGNDKLTCLEDDAQIVIIPDTTGYVCLTLQDAYALGLWLIAASSRVQTRYPESAGILD